jgi:cation:H+ antiporter
MTAVFLIAGFGLLYLGGEGLVRGSAALGVRAGMSPLVAGLTIVAFATSAPELAIALGAALKGVPDIAIGNVVGSNIANLALVLGITALVRPPSLRGRIVKRDAIVLVASTVLVPVLLLDTELSRLEGAFLVTCLLAYLFLTLRAARSAPHHAADRKTSVPVVSTSLRLNALLTAGSVAVLVGGSELLVRACVEIAAWLGVSEATVGLSVAALGTSLPELMTSIVAARHGQPEMAAGNLIGSSILNLLLILGATSLLIPLVRSSVSLVDLGVMIAVSLLALALMATKARVERREGALLGGIYVGYLAWLVAAST